MKENKAGQLLEETYVQELRKDNVVFTENDYFSLKKGKDVEIESKSLNSKFMNGEVYYNAYRYYRHLSAKLVAQLFLDDKYYEYVKKLFRGEIHKIQFGYINSEFTPTFSLSKVDVVSCLEELIKDDKIEVTDELIDKYKFLLGEIQFSKFEKENREKNFDIEIEGKTYSVPIKEILDFFKLSDEKFDELSNSKDITTISGLQKDLFAYIAYKFLLEKQLIDDYIIPTQVFKHFREIAKFSKFDIEAFNTFKKINDNNIDYVKVNEKLSKAILDEMPDNISEIEKAIYIYIKMCRTLTYDDEFFVSGQMGEIAKKHENVENVYNITPENKNVVCYEFNAIYGKLLESIGVNFVNSSYGSGNTFGGGHSELEFRSGKFLVAADAVKSILQGDMIYAKTNRPLKGLRCGNENTNTCEEFSELVTKMYQLIAAQEDGNSKRKVEHVETFGEVLAEYRQTVVDYPIVDLHEKVDILINKINAAALTGTDTFGYMLDLSRILFTKSERTDNVKIAIFGNRETENDQSMMASAVVVVNEDDNINDIEGNTYYFYNPNTELKPVKLKEIQEKFDNGIFDYVDDRDLRIPGVVEKGGRRYL